MNEIDAIQQKIDEAENQIQTYSKKIDYYITEYTIEILAQKMRQVEYTVPDYQRDFTWELERKSRFIESILIGLPIPFLFFWEDDITGKLEIVDGSQRLRTLEEYLNDALVLSGLDRLKLLNGTRFSDLKDARQRKIKNKSIRGIVLTEDTDMESRVDLFERINTGSKVANKAEVRRGVLQGPFMDLVISLSKDEKFVQLAPVTEKQLKERLREELVTRFFAYGDGLDDYSDNVSPFLYRYTAKMNLAFKADEKLAEEYANRFHTIMDFVACYFENGFKKNKTAKTSPRTRFEAISVGSYWALQEDKNLKTSLAEVNMWASSEAFISEIRSDGANAIRRLKGRIEFVKNALLGK